MDPQRPAPADEPRDALDDLGKLVQERWDEPKVHEAFVQACFDRRRLDVAARLYKAQASDPARAPVADKRLQTVVFLATQALEQDRAPPAPKNDRWLVLVAAVVCAASVAVLLYAITR